MSSKYDWTNDDGMLYRKPEWERERIHRKSYISLSEYARHGDEAFDQDDNAHLPFLTGQEIHRMHQEKNADKVNAKSQSVDSNLSIASPDSQSEQVADDVAAKVSSGQSVDLGGMSGGGGSSINPSGDGVPEVPGNFSSDLQSSKGGGSNMSEGMQSEMGSKMNADFSGVKLHTDSKANEMADSISAKAFTHGKDIYFGSGHGPENKELMAHELTHAELHDQLNAKFNAKTSSDFIYRDPVSQSDIDSIKQQLSFTLLGISRNKRKGILRQLSKYSYQDVNNAWKDQSGLKDHVNRFTASFTHSQDFRDFPLTVAAIFEAVDSTIRINRVKRLVSRKIFDDQALHIFYLIQGLSSDELQEAFGYDPLDPTAFNTNYQQFRLALSSDDAGLLTAAKEYELSKARRVNKADSALVDGIANRIYELLGLSPVDKELTGKKAEKQRKKFNKSVASALAKVGDPNEEVLAVDAYRCLKVLNGDELIDFGVRYASLYDSIIENLPIDFLHSSEFGLQQTKHTELSENELYKGKSLVDEHKASFHHLHTITKPHRFFYNNALLFAQALVAQGKTEKDNKELEKNYLADHRRQKVTTVRDKHDDEENLSMDALRSALPPGFVEPSEQIDFDVEYDEVFNIFLRKPGIFLESPNWIFIPGTQTINAEYVFTVLNSALHERLDDGEKLDGDIKFVYQGDKALLNSEAGLDRLFITSAMPGIGQDPQPVLIDELYENEGLMELYIEDSGIYQMVTDDTIWEKNNIAKSRLQFVLSAVVSGGYGSHVAKIVNSRITKKDPNNPNSFENESLAQKLGFDNGTFSEVIERYTYGNSKEPNMELGSLLDDLILTYVPSQLDDKKRKKFVNWHKVRKYLYVITHWEDLNMPEMIRAGAYFMEGLYLGETKGGLVRHAEASNIDLVAVQKNMGNQLYGFEMGDDSNSDNDHAFLNFKVDERKGTAEFSSPKMPIKAMYMQYSDMLFTSGKGEFTNLYASLKWPENDKSFDGYTLFNLDILELNNLMYQDNEMVFTLGKIRLENLKVFSDKPLANYAQMRNWSVLFYNVMGFVQNILGLLMGSLQVTSQRFIPDLSKNILNNEQERVTAANAEKSFSDFMLQQLAENQNIVIKYNSLNVEDMMVSNYGLIKSLSTGQGAMKFSDYDNNGNREMMFGFKGDQLAVGGMNMSGNKIDTLGSKTFDLGMVYSVPTDQVTGSRNLSSLSSLANSSEMKDAQPLSKLRKMTFNLSEMTGTGLELMGYKMPVLPFKNIEGEVETTDETKSGNVITPSSMFIRLKKVGSVDFLGFPFPADMSLRIVNNGNGQMSGDIIDAEIEMVLNEEKDQLVNGLSPTEIKINKLTVPKLTGNNFSLFTQGSETKITDGGFIENIMLSNFSMKHDPVKKDEWDLRDMKLSTGAVDMKGIGVNTASGLILTMPSFTAGSMSVGIHMDQSVKDDVVTETNRIDFSGTNVTTSGTFTNTSSDMYDPSKGTTTVSGGFEVKDKTLGGHQTTNTVNDEVTWSETGFNGSFESIKLPKLNVASKEMSITAPETDGKPIELNTVDADVVIHYNKFGDPDKFQINKVNVATTSTYGLLVKDLKTKKNILDLPNNVPSTINGFYIQNLTMEPRPFTPTEILYMQRDRQETHEQMPDYTTTFDFTNSKEGNNKIGFASSTFPEGMKLAIGSHIAAEMTNASSGAVWFEFVTTNDWKYSLTNVDAENIVINKDNALMFKGDLDTNSTSGSFKTEFVGEGMDAREKITFTVKTDIPEINAEEFHISSETMKVDMPQSEHQSGIKNLRGDLTVEILKPSLKQQDDAKAKTKENLKNIPNRSMLSPKELRDAEKAATVDALSDVKATITSLDIDSVTAFEASINSKSESKISIAEKRVNSVNVIQDWLMYPEQTSQECRTGEKSYLYSSSSIALQKDQAAIIRKIHAENLNIELTGLEKSHFRMYGKPNKTSFSIGDGKEKGFELGKTDITGDLFKRIIIKNYEKDKQDIEYSTTVTSSFEKLTFSGDTDSEYSATVLKPELDIQNESRNLTALDNHEDPSINKNILTGDVTLLNSDNGERLPLFSASSIELRQVKDEREGKAPYRKIIILKDPVISKLRINGWQWPQDDKGLMVGASSLVLDGKLGGEVRIEEDYTDLSYDDQNNSSNTSNKKESPIWHIYAPDSEIEIESGSFSFDLNSQIENSKQNKEIGANPPAPDYFDDSAYGFLDGASGTVSISIFGRSVSRDIVEQTPNGATQSIGGYIDINGIVEGLAAIFNDYVTTGTGAAGTLDSLFCEAHDNRYWLRTNTAGSNSDILPLLNTTGNNALLTQGNTEFVRLSALVKSIIDKMPVPPKSKGWWDRNLWDPIAESVTESTIGQLDSWLNRHTDPLNPQVDINATIDMSKVPAERKGIMGMFNDPNNSKLSFTLHANLSQDEMTEPGWQNRRDLVPEASITNIKVPPFSKKFGEEKEETANNGIKTASGIIGGKGMDIGKIKFHGTQHMGLADYYKMKTIYAYESVGLENIKIQGFDLKLFRKTK